MFASAGMDAPFTNEPYMAYLNRRARDPQGYSKEQCRTDLLKTAEQQKHLSGKWFLFPSPKSVDALWSKIASATVEGKLGTFTTLCPGYSLAASNFPPPSPSDIAAWN